EDYPCPLPARRMHGGRHVRDAWSGGPEHDDGPPRRERQLDRGKPGAPLVAEGGQANRAVRKLRAERSDGAPEDAERVLHAELLEDADERARHREGPRRYDDAVEA